MRLQTWFERNNFLVDFELCNLHNVMSTVNLSRHQEVAFLCWIQYICKEVEDEEEDECIGVKT